MTRGLANINRHDRVEARRPPTVGHRLGLCFLMIASLGCASSRSGALRSDIERYLQQMSSWAPIEAETARTLERILATEFVDEAEIRHQIADDRPRVLAHLERARAYSPQTATLQELHRTYLTAWQQLLDGYAAIELGFASGDYTNLSRGRESMASWRDGLVRIARQLGDLAEHEGIPTTSPKPQLT